MSKRPVLLAILLCALVQPSLAWAEAKTSQAATPPKLPASITLPWRFINVNPELVSLNRSSWEKTREVWEQEVIREPRPLAAAWAGASPATSSPQLSANMLKAIANMRAGAPTPALNLPIPIVLEPAFCPIGKYVLVFMTMTHARKHYLVASGHHVLARAKLFRQKKGKELEILPEVLSQSLQKASQRALMRTQNLSVDKEDALQISLRLGRELNRKDHASSWCLNLLISEALAQKGFLVLSSLGLEALMLLNRLYKSEERSYRATRTVLMHWSYPKITDPAKGDLPLIVNLNASYAEAVFASPIASLPLTEWKFALSPEEVLIYTLNHNFLNFLSEEKNALLYASPPKVSKIDRAWAYVDRGRAWGLKINDRLVVTGAQEQIKGHVVGFFGPELGLKSPEGWLINEGAIIYLRKGQEQLQLGQTFSFDSQRYPTPWPP